DRGANRRRAELRRREALQLALERAHRRSRGRDDHDWVGFHLSTPLRFSIDSTVSVSSRAMSPAAGNALESGEACPAHKASKWGLPALAEACRSLPVTLFCAGKAS